MHIYQQLEQVHLALVEHQLGRQPATRLEPQSELALEHQLKPLEREVEAPG